MNNRSFFEKQEISQPIYPELKFKSPRQLLKESWGIFRSKIKTLLGITGVPVGFSALFTVLIYFLSRTPIKYSIWFSVTEAISYFGSLFLWSWAVPAVIYSIKENAGLKESYKRGLKILIPYIWIEFLATAIVAGGFVLLIIPGILFSVWFILDVYVLIFEDKKGFDALYRSRQLIAGKFFGVLWRLLVLGVIVGIGMVIISITFGFVFPELGIEPEPIVTQMGAILGYFFQLLFPPFFLIYGLLIYTNLNEIKAKIPYQKPSKLKKIKYAIPGVLGLLVVGLLVIFLFLNIFFGRDEPPIDDSDLWFPKVEISNEENALYYLIPHSRLSQQEIETYSEYWPEITERIKQSKRIYWPAEKEELIDNIITGEEWDEELVKDLLENNEQVLNDLEKAIRCQYFQVPTAQDPKIVWVATPILSLRDLRTITKLNLIESIYFFKHGREKEAFDEAIKVIQMGQLMEDSPRPTFIGYLVGVKLKEMGLERLRAMLLETNLPPEVLVDYTNKLDKFKLNESGLINVIRMGYIGFSNSKAKIDAALAGKASPEELRVLGMEEVSLQEKAMRELNYLYKPNQTQRMLAESFRTSIENVNKYYSQMEFPEIKPPAPDWGIKAIFTENYIGKILHDMAVSYSGILQKKCEEDFSVIGTQLLMAIKAYQAETGKTPDSLNGLVPKYILEVPKDPFDGKPIRYLPQKKIIYSVGEDLKDSGGSEGDFFFEIKF